GAVMLASAAGGREFDHHGMRDSDEIDLGGLWLRALATPGHTGEHLAFLLLDGDRPVGVFTGGSLLAGAAARTDLVSPDRTEELARAQYQSLRRLAKLPDEVLVWPTHGAGSFCSGPSGGERTSSIGREKATNLLLRAPDEESFVAALLGSLGSFPPYFLRLPEINRRGPDLLAQPSSLDQLSVAQVQTLVRSGARLLDVRPMADFAACHPSGSLSIPLRGVFATWLGWIAPHDRPIVVIRADDQDPDEVAWQAAKVGYDNLAGELAGGIKAWSAAGLPTTRTPLVTAEKMDGQLMIDVRQAAEFANGHIPGALNIELGALAESPPGMPTEPLVVMCAHGERAMSAASLLEAAGYRDVAVLPGGAHEWAARRGGRLATGR
ncbi:MAG: MBL fold metallo-hydrolase, partial [Propionibacteriaceae bacterium]|nr:MBL fold metallo-hydrolase [Propionibacteriaceae bacterium]